MAKNNETTTKFKVDISELKSAMQEARKQVAYANSEFKAVSSSLDDWSKSSDGLSAKLKQLKSNLDSQEAVLKEYEKTLEEVKKEYGENSKEALEYATKLNNQQAVVNKIKKEMDGYEDALKEVSEAEKIAAKTGKDVSEVLNDVGNEAEEAEGGFTILKGAVADFVGNALTQLVDGLKNAISSLVTFADEADKAMNSFQASTGATAEEMAEFEDTMKNIYKNNYGESFEDIAAAMGEVKRIAGDIGAGDLEKMTTNALTLRDTFDFEVSESMRAVNSLMDQFGITSDQAFNLMAQGAQNGLNQNGDLLDVINEYSVQFKSAGYSADEMFNMLANGASTGTWSVDKLGDAVKEFNIRMSDGSAKDAVEALGFSWDAVSESWSKGGDDAKAVFNMLINELDGMENSVDGYGIGVGLLGTMFEDLGFDAVYALSDIAGEFDSTKKTMEEINAVKYDSVGEALQGIGRNLQTGILIPIGEKILPIVSELAAKFQEWLNDPATQAGLKTLTDGVAEFVDNGLVAVKDGVQWFLNNKDAVISGLSAIAAGFVAFKVVTLIQGVSKAMQGMTVAQYALNLAMSLNPIGIVVALLAGLVAGFVALWKTSDEFRGFWINLWENIKSITSTVIENIGKFFTETVPEFLNVCVNFFSGLAEKIWSHLVNAYNKVSTWATSMTTKAKETASNFINAVIDYIKTLPEKIWTWLVATTGKISEWASNVIAKAIEIGSNFITSIITFFEELPYKIGYILGFAIGKVIQWGTDLHNFVTTEIPKFINSIIDYIKELPEKIWMWLLNVINKVTEWGNNMVTNAIETASNFVNNIIEFISQLPTKVWTWLLDTINKVTTWAATMLNKAKEAASNFVNKVVEYVSQLPSKIWTYLTDIISKVTSWIVNLKNKAVEAGSSFINTVVSYISQLPSKIKTWLDDSISKLSSWVNDMKNKGKEAITGLIENVISGASTIPSKMLEIGRNIVDGVWNGINNAKDQFFNNVKGFFSGLVDGAKNALNINSPSKVFADEVGKWIPAGIAVGIDKNAKSALNSVKELAINTVGSAKAGLSTAATSLGGNTGGMGGVVNNFTQVINSPKQLSRLDIYRQSKNLLGYAGGGI